MTTDKTKAACSSVPFDPLVGLDKTERTGVGEWCAPGPASEQTRKWLLVFEDHDCGQSVYDNEADARAAFARAEGRGWNCHLFQHAPRVPPNG